MVPTPRYLKNKNMRSLERERDCTVLIFVLATMFSSKRIEQSSPREAKCRPACGEFPACYKI